MSRGLHLLELGVRWPPETFVQRKLEALAAAGVRVTVASRLAPGAQPEPIDGIDLLPLGHWSLPRRRKLVDVVLSGLGLTLRRPRRARALMRAVRGPLAPRGRSGFWHAIHLLHVYLPVAALDPDVVQYEWETAAIEHLPLTEVWECPVLMSCRGTAISIYPHMLGEQWVERLPEAFDRAAAVHCVSDATVREAELQGLDRAKAHVVRTSVDSEFFSPAPTPTGEGSELRVVSVGTLRWVKGCEYAVHAVARLAATGIPVRLDLVGPDPSEELAESGERERVLWTAADSGLGGRVTLHGAANREEVRRRLRQADVLLHASLAEGIPNVMLEAMACGVPVVVTDCGGVREAITDGVEGFVVAPRDTSAMASAMERLWREPDLRRRMGRAGRQRAERFTAESQAEGFMRMLGAANGRVGIG